MTDGLVRIGTTERRMPTDAPRASGGPRAIRIHPSDNVAVAIHPLAAGERIRVDDIDLEAIETVQPGHKVALAEIANDAPVVKYGYPIGAATERIGRGAWVHSHNLRTRLAGTLSYHYSPAARLARSAATPGAEAPRDRGGQLQAFEGYRRANGGVGTRNEIWILNTVGCVNHAAERIAREMGERLRGVVDGVHTFTHPYGCSQLGDDLGNTRKVLSGLLRHPNAGGVLLLGLGCENNQLDELLASAGPIARERVRFFNSQDVGDEVEEGGLALRELAAVMESDRRTTQPASALVLGQKCGGSDGFSGISANALVGRISDRITAIGGRVLLTEVPEMFGAEEILMNRAVNKEVFDRIVAMVDGFKQYFIRHGQPVYENPSPGNKAGGLTTLEEKSLGAIQKGGHGPVSGVLRYGEPVRDAGLSLLESPGNDGVSSTAMVASGATILLFTTGRGTPLGFPAPTIKISSNSGIAERKPHWIDFNAGALLDGTAAMPALEEELLALILDVASGRKLTNSEKHGVREIAIWKDGVTL